MITIGVGVVRVVFIRVGAGAPAVALFIVIRRLITSCRIRLSFKTFMVINFCIIYPSYYMSFIILCNIGWVK